MKRLLNSVPRNESDHSVDANANLAFFGHGFADFDSLFLQLDSLGFLLAAFVAFRASRKVEIATLWIAAGPITFGRRSPSAAHFFGRHLGSESLYSTVNGLSSVSSER